MRMAKYRGADEREIFHDAYDPLTLRRSRGH